MEQVSIVDLQQEIVSLKETMTSKDAEIVSLKGSMRAVDSMSAQLNSVIEMLSQRLREYQDLAKERKSIIDRCEREINAKDREIERLKAQIEGFSRRY